MCALFSACNSIGSGLLSSLGKYKLCQISQHQGRESSTSCSHPAEGRWWFGVSTVGDEELEEQCWWQRGESKSSTAERSHPPLVLMAAADCLGMPSKGASRLLSLWKPQLPCPPLPLSGRPQPGDQENITTAVSPRRKGLFSLSPLWPVTGSCCPPDCAWDENALRMQADTAPQGWDGAVPQTMSWLCLVNCRGQDQKYGYCYYRI